MWTNSIDRFQFHEFHGVASLCSSVGRDVQRRSFSSRYFSFTPIDLYKAQAKYFSIVDGKIMPAFTAIDGLGDKNAELIEYEAAKDKFLSKEDFSKRTKTNDKLVATMSRLGILEGMTESNQISLFDMF